MYNRKRKKINIAKSRDSDRPANNHLWKEQQPEVTKARAGEKGETQKAREKAKQRSARAGGFAFGGRGVAGGRSGLAAQIRRHENR